MDPPLRERLRWRTATGEGVDSPARHAPLAPTAGLLFAAAALICLAGVVLPGDAELDEGVLLATAGVAAAVAAFLFIANERVPDWTYHPIGLAGTAVATGRKLRSSPGENLDARSSKPLIRSPRRNLPVLRTCAISSHSEAQPRADSRKLRGSASGDSSKRPTLPFPRSPNSSGGVYEARSPFTQRRRSRAATGRSPASSGTATARSRPLPSDRARPSTPRSERGRRRSRRRSRRSRYGGSAGSLPTPRPGRSAEPANPGRTAAGRWSRSSRERIRPAPKAVPD